MGGIQRTESQIQQAKARAVGGKRKRCTKGKSCSATCIAANKVCLVEIPWVAASTLPKVVESIRKQVEPQSVRPPKLPELKTGKQFDTLYYADDPAESQQAHKDVGSIFKSIESKFAAKKDKLIAELGLSGLANSMKALKAFTGEEYSKIRKSQHYPNNKSLDKQREKAKAVEALLEKLPKAPIIKYRGISVTEKTLSEIKAAAKGKRTYSDGALASWSSMMSIAAGFATSEDTKPVSVMFRTVNKRGVAVKELASFDWENEVITPGSAKYRHTGNYRVIPHYGKTYHVFDVVEL